MAGRRHKHEEHENLERWLLTYADMITLLMAFFIMLYSMSQLDLAKFHAMAGALRQELGGSGVLTGSSGLTQGGPSPLKSGGLQLAPRPELAAASQVQAVVRKQLRDLTADRSVQVLARDDTVVIRVPTTDLLFAPGSATPTPRMVRIATRVGRIARQQGCAVRAEGHTCNLPIRSALYPSNWELSADRARNLALYLVRHSLLPPERVAFMGYADTRPLLPNSSEANRRRNRRVEFVLTPATVPGGSQTVAPDAANDRSTAHAAASPTPASIGRLKIDLRPLRLNLPGRVQNQEETP